MFRDKFFYYSKSLVLFYLFYLTVRNFIFIFSTFDFIPFDEDFNHYFAGSYLIKEGLPLFETYLSDLKLKEFLFSDSIPKVTNPPLLQLLLCWLSFLNPHDSHLVYFIISFLCCILSIYFFLRTKDFNFNKIEILIIFGSFLSSYFFYY